MPGGLGQEGRVFDFLVPPFSASRKVCAWAIGADSLKPTAGSASDEVRILGY